MTVRNQDFLLEQVKTIKNLCEVAIVIRGLNRGDLLPTILETIFEQAQAMNDEHCVVK